MATTSIHLPGDLLEQLDRTAGELGVSRNRLIVDACRDSLERRRPRWPDGFFSGSHLSEEDRELLREGAGQWTEELLAARRGRSESPF